MEDEVQHWHVHDCDFQLVLVLNGWAEFEYEGQGVHRIRKGDCILQPPRIRHRENRVLEGLRGAGGRLARGFRDPDRGGSAGRRGLSGARMRAAAGEPSLPPARTRAEGGRPVSRGTGSNGPGTARAGGSADGRPARRR